MATEVAGTESRALGEGRERQIRRRRIRGLSKLTCTVSNCLQSGVGPQGVEIVFYFICTGNREEREEGWLGEGEGRARGPAFAARRRQPPTRPLKRRYGGSNKGTAVHRGTPRLLFGMPNECYHPGQTVTYLPLTRQQAAGEAREASIAKQSD